MEVSAVVERVERIAAVRADVAAGVGAMESALRASTELKAWLAAGDAEIGSRLSAAVSFPEKSIADCTRESQRDAAKARERASTLDRVPGLADALDAADVTPGHVDAITSKAKPLHDEAQRAEFFERVGGLLDVAAAASVEEFRRRLSLEARAVERDDGMERLERQRRQTGLRVWTDAEGMWRFDGRFDPVLGVGLDARLQAELQVRFAEAVPDTCPNDPVLKQRHLRALAFAALVNGEGASRPGRGETIVVVDADQPNGSGGPTVDWGIPVEIPSRVLADLMSAGQVSPVVVRSGVILHAPGELDLGRTTRLANRAQRRALQALYATCSIPGCEVPFSRCKLHHIAWWRHGGRTDLHNLLPVCTHHHSKIHHDGWIVELGPNRQLTLRLADGSIHNTGPPSRRAA
jgi:hypothetical protein